jgi:hypothetical protein
MIFLQEGNNQVFPSYDSIRSSLSGICEILAEADGTILSISAGMHSIIPESAIRSGNIWNWNVI